MLIPLNDVLKDDGKVLHLTAELGLTEFTSKIGTYPIIEKSPVELTLSSKGDRKLKISGNSTVTLLIPCGRCLEDVPTTLDLELEKEVDMKQSEEERKEALDENVFIHGYDLDVDEMVFGEILLNWPLRILCKEDCKGICSICGANLNKGTCSCDRTDYDPRMVKIRDIFSKFKEV